MEVHTGWPFEIFVCWRQAREERARVMESSLLPLAKLRSGNMVQNKEKITTSYHKWQQQAFSKALSLLKLQE